MLKKVTLGFAERNFALMVVGRQKSVTIPVARIIRSLRKDLALRAVEKELQAETEEAQKTGTNGPTWDELLDREEQAGFTTEESNLRQLQEWLTKDPWEIKMADREGKEVLLPIAPGQIEALANLADAIQEALS